MLLRFVMMVYGFDQKGLLVAGHMSMILCWVIAAGFLLGLVWGVNKLEKNRTYAQLYPESFPYGFMIVLAGAGLIPVSLTQGSALQLVLGMAAGFCMIFTGFCRIYGKRPHFGYDFVVCIYFILNLISGYRVWSVDPQLQDYAFQILASVMLMLAAFYCASADANTIDCRKLVFTCLTACFFCIVSISDPVNPIYYAACGLWALGHVGQLKIGNTGKHIK